jgi:perosamine synthetase
MSDKYAGNELKYIEKVLNSENLGSTLGDFTNTLEQMFANVFNAKYAVACNSGTSALHMALKGVNANYGSEVIMPALSVIMNSTSAFHNNCIPVYADVDEDTFTIDPEDVKRKITGKTKAIMAVSLYGYPSKIRELKKICGDIPIIEDNAEHLGLLRSDVAIYSFESTKHLSTGEMGMLLTNDKNIALKARLLSNHGFKNTSADNGKTKTDASIFQDPDYERHTSLGWNYRATEFQSAIAIAQLEIMDYIVNRRIKYAELFNNTYALRSDLFKPQEYHSCHTFWTFAVRCLEDKEFWRMFYKKFVDNGGDGFWSAWKLQYQEPLIRSGEFKEHCPTLYYNIHYNDGICPVAEYIQPQIIQHKFNYRDEKLFDNQVLALEKTIKEL